MPHYKVRWEIDITADDPVAAVCEARAAQTRPGTTATIFSAFEVDPSSRRPIAVYECIDLGGPGEQGNGAELAELLAKSNDAAHDTPGVPHAQR